MCTFYQLVICWCPSWRTQVHSLMHLDLWYCITDNHALGRNYEYHGMILENGFDISFVLSNSKKFIRSTRWIRIGGCSSRLLLLLMSFLQDKKMWTQFRAASENFDWVNTHTEIIELMLSLVHNIRKQAFRLWKKFIFSPQHTWLKVVCVPKHSVICLWVRSKITS